MAARFMLCLGKSNVDDEPLLPTRVDAAVSAAAAAVAGQQDGGAGGGVVVQGSSSASMGVQMAPADE